MSLDRDEALREVVGWLHSALRHGLEVCENYRAQLISSRMEIGVAARQRNAAQAEITELKARLQSIHLEREELRAKCRELREDKEVQLRVASLAYNLENAKLHNQRLQQAYESVKEAKRVANNTVLDLRRQLKDALVSIEALQQQLLEATRGAK